MYLEKNRCELTIVNELGKAAVVASLGPGDFFGESCLAGQRFRMGTATAIPPCTVLVVEKDEMFKALTSSMPSLTGSSNTCWHGSQETLVEMIGTTRSQVTFFMNKFRKPGFVKYTGGLQIDTSLLRVVLHE
jgi:CRP/FNR family transcriptional regulator, cyclic AMP receptor protein